MREASLCLGVMIISFLQAVLLGIVQGITEFLPVSSSGHLVILPALFGIPKPPLSFDVLLHLATGVAVAANFKRELFLLLQGMVKGEKEALRLAGWLAAGTIPAVAAGLFFRETVERFFSVPVFAGAFLLVTGFFLWLADRYDGTKDYQALGLGGALLVGVFQALALLPGISRSGATITAGRALGLSRREAARFSFFLSIPLIFGAGIYEALPLLSGKITTELTLSYLGGMLAAGVSGFLVIRYFLRYLGAGKLRPFMIYCWIVGTAFILVNFLF